MVTTGKIDSETQAQVDKWLAGAIDEGTKNEIRRLQRENPSQLVDAFYTTLKFGTGGLRGVMGPGTNRMNTYTVRAATQGLANYLKSEVDGQKSVFIGYDCRKNSPEFARDAARVLAGNGIKVYLCPELRPTPFVSFGCREKGCQAAIMVTASHNPPEYNGYKVYWDDGGQILPPHDKGIIDEVAKITDFSQVQLATDDSLIETVTPDLDEAYLSALDELQFYPEENKEHGRDLKVVFSNLHGTGITLIPQTLKRWGFTSYYDVESQKEPDGTFPTVSSPNPEERDALKLGIERLNEVDGDLLLATDPDGDRMAAVVRDGSEVTLLNGNQIASIALWHICGAYNGKLPKKAAFVKTIVTTELLAAIAEDHGRPCANVLTGFKYIAEKIREWDESGEWDYLFGGEESYGYLLGTHSRDKDAVIACALITEAASHAKRQGKTLVDLLNELYERYGIYRETLVSIKFPETRKGREQMASALSALRSEPPTEFAGVAVDSIEDYSTGVKTWSDGRTEELVLPKSDVLLYWLADKSKLVVRPSGTEPKVKVYCGVAGKESIEKSDQHASNLVAALQERLSC